MAENIRSKRHDTMQIAQLILNSHPSEYTRRLSKLLSEEKWADVLALEKPEASAYTCADSFRVDYMAFNLLRKFDSFDLPIDKRANAINAWLGSEVKCRFINMNHARNPALAHRELYLHDYCLENSLEAKIHFARELIAKTLGRFSWDKAHSRFGFSSGASTRLKRATGHPFYKFQGIPEVTREAAPLAIADIKSSELWRGWFENRCSDPTKWVKIVEGCRAETVPKDSETERPICPQPDLNMRFQRGIGQLLREALKRVGVNLNSQDWNSELARIGSCTGSLATVDLKGASDSISLSVVKLLLPEDWFDAICRTRTSRTLLDGKYVELEKVSSMGNGFTFELESLIFWALSKSVLSLHNISDTRLAVYGDDIVIHNSAVEPLELLLSYVGFEFNHKKTHHSGPFRESCGEHYFYGIDVKPFYIKTPIESEDRYYWIINSYCAWLKRHGSKLTKAYFTLVKWLKESWPNPCYVPIGYGFTAGIEIESQYSRSVWSLRKQAYLFRALVPVREIHKPNGRPALLAWFDACGIKASEREMMLHKGDAVYQRFWRSTSQWS